MENVHVVKIIGMRMTGDISGTGTVGSVASSLVTAYPEKVRGATIVVSGTGIKRMKSSKNQFQE